MGNVPASITLGLTLLMVVGCSEDSGEPLEPRTAPSGGGTGLAAAGGTLVVSSAAELVAALAPENAGRRILVEAGEYAIATPLTVPDGATLEGEGVMRFDGAGLPAGFVTGTRTSLTMTANTPGDLLTLGDGVTIRGLEISDLAGRAGNVVAVVSRHTGDRLSATIVECEIVNPNPLGAGPEGPTGRGVLVLTRNPNVGADPVPHEGAALAARMVRSVIRSPAAGGGLFAFNFAALGRVSVTVEGSIVGGGVDANGGVSRPDAVHDAEVSVDSRRNLYRDDSAAPCLSPLPGWNLTGGSGPPVPIPAAETARNTVRVNSVDDRIEGFKTGIRAFGSRRFFPIAGPSTGNAIDLVLQGAGISTPACGGDPSVADLDLAGAFSADDALLPGNGNTLRAVIHGVTGSGQRFNLYANSAGPSGPLPAGTQGLDNRLEIVGSPEAFTRTNSAIAPSPETHYFTGAAD